jgi:hypothetical protein
MIFDWQDTIDAFLEGRAPADALESLSRRLDVPPDGRAAAADVLALDAGLARVLTGMSPPRGAVERLLGALGREQAPAVPKGWSGVGTDPAGGALAALIDHGRGESDGAAGAGADVEGAMVAEMFQVASAVDACLVGVPVPRDGAERVVAIIRAEDDRADVGVGVPTDAEEADGNAAAGGAALPIFAPFGHVPDVRAASKEEPDEAEQERPDEK